MKRKFKRLAGIAFAFAMLTSTVLSDFTTVQAMESQEEIVLEKEVEKISALKVDETKDEVTVNIHVYCQKNDASMKYLCDIPYTTTMGSIVYSDMIDYSEYLNGEIDDNYGFVEGVPSIQEEAYSKGNFDFFIASEGYEISLLLGGELEAKQEVSEKKNTSDYVIYMFLNGDTTTPVRTVTGSAVPGSKLMFYYEIIEKDVLPEGTQAFYGIYEYNPAGEYPYCYGDTDLKIQVLPETEFNGQVFEYAVCVDTIVDVETAVVLVDDYTGEVADVQTFTVPSGTSVSDCLSLVDLEKAFPDVEQLEIVDVKFGYNDSWEITPDLNEIVVYVSYLAPGENAKAMNITYKDGCDGAAFDQQYYEFLVPMDSELFEAEELIKAGYLPEFKGTPARAGYVFKGWEYEMRKYPSLEAYAKWEKVNPTYQTVVLNLANKNNVIVKSIVITKEIKVEYGDRITVDALKDICLNRGIEPASPFFFQSGWSQYKKSGNESYGINGSRICQGYTNIYLKIE